MPPEIYANHAFDGFANDIWACGVILFIMLVGLPPFECADDKDPRYRIIQKGGLMTMLDGWNRSISNEAGDLLQNMLYENRKDRLSLTQIMEHPWVSHEGDSIKNSSACHAKRSQKVSVDDDSARNVKFVEVTQAGNESLHHELTVLRRCVTAFIKHENRGEINERDETEFHPECTILRRLITCSF